MKPYLALTLLLCSCRIDANSKIGVAFFVCAAFFAVIFFVITYTNYMMKVDEKAKSKRVEHDRQVAEFNELMDRLRRQASQEAFVRERLQSLRNLSNRRRYSRSTLRKHYLSSL